MKRYKYILGATIGTMFLLTPAVVSAQAMMGQSYTSNSGLSDTQKGETVYNNLQNKQTTCGQLSNIDFDELGDFYMSRMMGSSSDGVMDQQIVRYMGNTANTQMHIALAKRLSGCNPNAIYPASASNYAPVAGMTGMISPGSMMSGYWNHMGNFDNSSWTGTDTTLTVLLVLSSSLALFAWLHPRNQSSTSPQDMLKQRYAKGELGQKDYEEQLKDLKK